MERILFLASVEPDGSLSKAALESLNAASKLSGNWPASSFYVGLIGQNVQAAADRVATCGRAEFLGVQGADFGVSRYGSDAAAAEALTRAAKATIVVAPATSRLCRALPGVAQRLSGRIDTHVTGILPEQESLHIQRWYYRQRIRATLTRGTRPWLLLLAPGVCEPWQGRPGSAPLRLVPLDLPADSCRTQVVGFEEAAASAKTIRPDAELLFVAGAGWTKKQSDGQTHIKEAEELILGFLEKTRASLGSSKSLVEQSSEGQAVLSFMTHLNQVGQTGSTPRHPKGLATCCHGEEPHVVGWRFIQDRRAVNLDPNCGWAQGKADVLYVADAFEVLSRVNEQLS